MSLARMRSGLATDPATGGNSGKCSTFATIAVLRRQHHEFSPRRFAADAFGDGVECSKWRIGDLNP